MEYRAKSHFDALAWLLLNGLMWVGIAGLAWNMLKPGGWLFWAIDFVLREQPAGYYYLAVALCGVVALKLWLDSVGPRAFRYLLTAACAFAGTMFILRMLLPI